MRISALAAMVLLLTATVARALTTEQISELAAAKKQFEAGTISQSVYDDWQRKILGLAPPSTASDTPAPRPAATGAKATRLDQVLTGRCEVFAMDGTKQADGWGGGRYIFQWNQGKLNVQHLDPIENPDQMMDFGYGYCPRTINLTGFQYDGKTLVLKWNESARDQSPVWTWTLQLDGKGKVSGTLQTVNPMNPYDNHSSKVVFERFHCYSCAEWTAILSRDARVSNLVALLGPPDLTSEKKDAVAWNRRVETPASGTQKESFLRLDQLSVSVSVFTSGPDKGQPAVYGIFNPVDNTHVPLPQNRPSTPKPFTTSQIEEPTLLESYERAYQSGTMDRAAYENALKIYYDKKGITKAEYEKALKLRPDKRR